MGRRGFIYALQCLGNLGYSGTFLYSLGSLFSFIEESWFVLGSATGVPFSDDTMTSQKRHILLLVLVAATFCGAVHGFLLQSVLSID